LINKIYPKTYIFDLDKTLIINDSFKGFVIFLLKKKIRTLFILPELLRLYLIFLLNKNNRNACKFLFIKKLIRQFTSNEIKKISKHYAENILNKYFNLKMLKVLQRAKKNGHDVYIATASIDLYCLPLAQKIGAKLIATEISLEKKTYGEIIGKNCYGVEKKKKYNFYLNS
jgi:HAD superfamily phosphoserine phosphatase-like hydrolase